MKNTADAHVSNRCGNVQYEHRQGEGQALKGSISSTDLLENKEYNTGSSLDHQAKVLSGISCFVWQPYKYSVYDRGTTAPHVSAKSWSASHGRPIATVKLN